MSSVTPEPPIVVEENYPVEVSRLWDAISVQSQMIQWYFPEIPEFRPEIGFETQFTVHCEGTDYLHLWNVTDCQPGKSLSYRWRYGGIEGDSFVKWDLTETEQGSRLNFSHNFTQPFPTDDNVFNREACQGGWNYFLSQSLKNFFDG